MATGTGVGVTARASGSPTRTPPGGDGPDPQLELTVDSIAAGGDGVARQADGRVVFVPRTAPGDRVLARLVEARPSYARGLPIRILAPGPDRVSPECPHTSACGGCQLQHLSLPAQRAARRRILADALSRIGGIEVEVPEPVAVDPPLGYRNRVRFTLRRSAARVVAGYRRYDAPGELLDVDDCPLAEAPLRAAWTALRRGWGGGAEALPAGDELQLTLRSSEAGAVALLVEGGTPGAAGDVERLRDALPTLESYHWRDDRGARRRLAGSASFTDRWGGIELRLRPEAFVQVNRRASARLEAWLEETAGPASGRRLLDLYAGVGVRAIRWARQGGEAVACEVGADSVASGREAAERLGAAVQFVESRVEQSLGRVLPADLVVVNPPRRGLSRTVSRRLARGGAARLAYVSCDPATLARDIRRLRSGWTVERVQPFDAFPQTAHVETVVWLRPAGDAR